LEKGTLALLYVLTVQWQFMWVAIVEDQEAVGRSLKRRLRGDLGVEAYVAGDLAAMLEHLSRLGPPGALILDHSLADGVTGASVLAALRRGGTTAPCAFWTGSGSRAVAHALRVAGIDERPPCFTKGDDAIIAWIHAVLLASPLSI